MARARSGRKADFTWQGNGAGFSIASGSTVILTINTPSVTSTLMRTRGEILASIDGPVDGDKTLISVGLIVGTPEQVAAGTGSFPNPFDDMDGEWLWHGFLPLLSQGVVATENSTIHAARLAVDSKAMRRMKQTQSVVAIATVDPLAGTPAVDLIMAFRQLFAE